GTSEHQLGLALDIVDTNERQLNSTQANNATQQWMMENCWKYGFILRFPEDKEDITGIIYEPWHYRYVGKEAAKEITEQGVCLEEYLGKEDH
ncbi:MAG: M15 family metallopeptidase, partial [Oscillospiraceae bacterium]|nr:M15 family metallopeptidase [Oscillospiraceae bacterium]